MPDIFTQFLYIHILDGASIGRLDPLEQDPGRQVWGLETLR